MATPLSWLATCKLSQLHAIAIATGVNSTGTKKLLSERLLSTLQQEKLSLPRSRFTDNDVDPQGIISIDMGIRNLAYCQITLPPSPTGISSPIISAWERIAVAPKADNLPDVSPKNAKVLEAFDPATYSQHAYELITRLLRSSSPKSITHILIERQRFRSMGGSAVQEWTLRVNMFEAMLYAVLKTLHHQGIWKGSVWPIMPSKVGKFWLDGLNEERMTKKRKSKKGNGNDMEDGSLKHAAKTNGKREKIELVNQWLQEGRRFELREGAKETGNAWLRKKKIGGRKKTVDGEGGKLGKLDDLADCLLQGFAWVRWEANRRELFERGLEALDEIRQSRA